MRIFAQLGATTAPHSVVLIRLLAGWVFVSEGIQKFLFADADGAGRFAKIGIPYPDFTGPFVGTVEILCGTLLILGLLTRLATIPVLISMTVAVISTKIPILLGHPLGPFALPKLPTYGMWSMLHESRTDFSMILALLFLLLVGAGRASLDAILWPRR